MVNKEKTGNLDSRDLSGSSADAFTNENVALGYCGAVASGNGSYVSQRPINHLFRDKCFGPNRRVVESICCEGFSE